MHAVFSNRRLRMKSARSTADNEKLTISVCKYFQLHGDVVPHIPLYLIGSTASPH